MFDEKLSNAWTGVCEIHVTKALSQWVDKNIGRAVTKFYKNEFRCLIREQTRALHDEKVIERKQRWDPRFEMYWDQSEAICPLHYGLDYKDI